MEGNGEHIFGSALRTAREAAGLSVEELANITRIQSRYLRALEAEDWDRVPTGVIGRGFVRVVAKQIGADAASLPELYRNARQETDSQPEHALPEADWEVSLGRNRKGRTRALLGGGAAVALLLALWLLTSWQPPAGDDDDGPKESQVVAEPTPTPPAPPAEAAPPQPSAAPETPAPTEPVAAEPGPHRLSIQAVERTWVRVIVAGTDAQDHEFLPGEKVTFEAPGAVTVRLGNAAGVRMSWDGEPLKLAGKSGAVVTLRFPEALEQLRP